MCIVFANRRKYSLSWDKHFKAKKLDNSDDNNDDSNDKGSVKGDNTIEKINEVDVDVEAAGKIENVSNHENSTAHHPVDISNENMLLRAGKHIQMANAQRHLYQALELKAVTNSKEKVMHQHRTYTLFVDCGQNIECPFYAAEQPSIIYYYTPLIVYVLGCVDHAHAYSCDDAKAHMHAHVYDGVGRKGSNNVCSLIMKTHHHMGIIKDDEKGGTLNIVYDNCSGQNKNNTVLRLVPYLIEIGYF